MRLKIVRELINANDKIYITPALNGPKNHEIWKIFQSQP